MKREILENTGIIALLFSTVIFFNTLNTFSQLKNENFFIKWGSWVLLQSIPSPSLFEDRNENSSKVKFGLEWQMIPVSYSFNANKYVSNFNFFHIRPNKRFSGSVETFFEPAYLPGGFKNNELKKFMYKTGLRIVIPVFHRGEYLSFSLGAGYYNQKTPDNLYDGITYEAGVYSFFGMMGLKFNYNQNALSRYNISLYIKYY
ncbi:MAG: hypothetical protein ABI543_05080 [Ignavibacteria bacterium]